ncbi:hypothetical protein Tco_1342472, partial [Tanacetum coccineum]
LRRQIEEAVRSGQLSHLVKEIKQGGKRGEHEKAAKKREAPNKEKATTIFMVQPWQRITRQKTTQSFYADQKIYFSTLGDNSGQETPIVIEAEVEGHLIHRINDIVSTLPPREPTATEGIKVAIHPKYPEQTITIGGSLSKKGRMELCNLLKENLDIFAWKPADMTGVSRSIAEHHLNVREGCQPIRKKIRGQSSDRNKAIQEEVAKLVEAEIMREVY